VRLGNGGSGFPEVRRVQALQCRRLVVHRGGCIMDYGGMLLGIASAREGGDVHGGLGLVRAASISDCS